MRALLLAFSCLVLLAVACGGGDFDSDSASSGGGSSASSAGLDAGGGDTASPTSNTQFLPEKLIITTNIDVEVTDLRTTYAALSNSVRQFGGFVAEAQLNDDEDHASAFLRLRVPSAYHDELVASVRNTEDARVMHEDSTAREVTAEYTDLQSRLTNLQVTEAQYQELVRRAGSIDEVLKVTARLDEVRAEIEQVEGRIKLIEDQADFATVAIRLTVPAAVGNNSGLPSPVRVLVDSLVTSLTMAHAALNLLIVLLVAGLWLIPATVMAALAWRRFRSRFEAIKTWFG